MKRIIIGLILVLVIAWAPGRSGISHAASPADQPTLTVMAAGDTACDPSNADYNGGQGDDKFCQQKATSDLVAAAHPDAVLALGDNQYEDAALSAFLQSYDPTWGRFLNITYPVLGNHEYLTPGATGYFAYYGSRAGTNSGGYYSFNLGAWHLIALNSECNDVGGGGCGFGGQQEQWLVNDLAANRSACTLAFWHEPRFTSGRNLNHPALQAFWQDLYAFGTDLVLNGHDHIYERFAPQNPLQQPDAQGIRELIVGTGGNNHQPNYGTIQPNSEARDNKTYGVLKLTLRSDSYDWQFLPAKHTGNGTFTDKGIGTCHGSTPDAGTPSAPRAIPLVTASGSIGVVGRFTVDFTSSKPGQGAVLFGPGPGCSGLVMTSMGDQGAGTTHHVFVVTGNDLPGTVGDIGITPGATYWYETVTTAASGTEIDNNGGKCYSVTIPSS
jgi:hypothetical protein